MLSRTTMASVRMKKVSCHWSVSTLTRTVVLMNNPSMTSRDTTRRIPMSILEKKMGNKNGIGTKVKLIYVHVVHL